MMGLKFYYLAKMILGQAVENVMTLLHFTS